MTATIAPEKLAVFETLALNHGSHAYGSGDINDGACAMEVVSWLADEGWTDAPACASPVLTRYIIRLNDRWDDEKRQSLKPYLLRTIGTGNDGKDARREEIALEWTTKKLLGPWLRLAGLDDHADAIEASDKDNARRLIRTARAAAWRLRDEKWSERRKVIRAKLTEAGVSQPAVVAAVAAADAVAAAAADAAVAADAVAAVAVAADAAAVAADAADAAAVAAVADAVAAVAAAVAVAVVADVPPYEVWGGKSYSAAYEAAHEWYRANPLPIAQQVADIAASQEGAALELLDLLIDADETSTQTVNA